MRRASAAWGLTPSRSSVRTCRPGAILRFSLSERVEDECAWANPPGSPGLQLLPVATNNSNGKRHLQELERRRHQAAGLLRQGLSQAETARQLSVSRESVRRWANLIQLYGAKRGLKNSPRIGRKPRLENGELKQLKRILNVGPQESGYGRGAWSLRRIARVIRREFGVRYHVRHVSWILRKKLNWTGLSARR